MNLVLDDTKELLRGMYFGSFSNVVAVLYWMLTLMQTMRATNPPGR